MPRGGFRVAGPGKKIGRPKSKVKRVKKSIDLFPAQWDELRARKPDLSYRAAIEDLLKTVKKYEDAQ